MLACLAIYDVFIAPPKPLILRATAPGSSDVRDGAGNLTDTNSGNSRSIEQDEFANYDAIFAQEEDDLSTSLRCYRGPALLALALFCSAYSLRIWRRNGVACDELLFLPGTPHEYRCTGGNEGSSSINNNNNNNNNAPTGTPGQGDLSRIIRRQRNLLERSPSFPITQQTEAKIGTCFSEGDAAAGAANNSFIFQLRSQSRRSHEALVSSSSGEFGNEATTNPGQLERRPLMVSQGGDDGDSISAPTSPTDSSLNPEESPILYIRDQAQSLMVRGLDMLVVSNLRPPLLTSAETSPRGDTQSSNVPVTPSTNEVYDADYAPSGPQVLGAALDLSLPVLFNFHMFVVLMKDHYRKEAEVDAENETPIDDVGDGKIDVKDDVYSALTSMTPPQVPPKVLPLFFLSAAIVRTQIPRKSRQRFYKTILQGTALVPFRPVRFRDAFVGDCVTSLVRPIVDIVFAVTYYGAAVYGLVSQKYDLNETGIIVSNSKLMHGLILPLFAILPLWLRFIQTLRQAYDTGKRWPYLGNSFKYLTAGLVILYGMTHAAGQRNVWWTVSFVATTIYQIVWDSCMDWELLVFAPQDGRESSESTGLSLLPNWLMLRVACPSFVSSLNPRLYPSRLLGFLILPFRKRILQPVSNVCRRGRDAALRWNQIRLRPQRLYNDDSFYWRALFVNAALRFCWMMGFIPAYRISIWDGSTQETFAQGNSWTFVILATLEIARRCIWGIIKVELETIKLTNGGENDLTMASTADEYLREGKWNAWRKYNIVDNSSRDDDTEQLIDTPQRANKDDAGQTEPATIKQEQAHRWLGMTVSSGFLRWAYFVELSLWPLVFLIAGYHVVLAE